MLHGTTDQIDYIAQLQIHIIEIKNFLIEFLLYRSLCQLSRD